MRAIVLAGGQPQPGDPMFGVSAGQPKALLDLDGRTLLEVVLAALSAATCVDSITVVGLDWLPFPASGDKPIQLLPDQGDLVANAQCGLAAAPAGQAGHVLFSAADLPALTTAAVERFASLCGPLEAAVYYPVVRKGEIEARYPGSGRTYARLDGQLATGGNLVIASAAGVDADARLWKRLVRWRKQPWRLAGLLGPTAVIRLATGRLTTLEVERKASRLLGRPLKLVACDCPELAMDIDWPEQLELLRALRAE
ncbi:MAG: nucleotidyltransferase family protein [Candidatus Promineifilaceae bacterium]